MRLPRLTYEGAYHHVMNRGLEKRNIFESSMLKESFLDILAAKSKKLKIRIFAYCVMDNHYHLVLENSSGKMSEFLKQLNGEYGTYYRKQIGGRGYVFEGRYKSTIIENDSYLKQSIIYVLSNPLRAGIVQHAGNYPWSSLKEYSYDPESKIVDSEFVIELFGHREELPLMVNNIKNGDLHMKSTKYGGLLGSDKFLEFALSRFDRRKGEPSQLMRRKGDRYFEPVEKVVWEFENIKETKLEKINFDTLVGKQLRGEFLVLLKERTGLTYAEILRFDIFSDLRYSSLRSLYRNTKKRLEKQK